MKCIYCQQDCILNPDTADRIRGSYWLCNNHPMKVVFNIKEKQTSPSAIGFFGVPYKDRLYDIEIYYISYFSADMNINSSYFDIRCNHNLIMTTTKLPANLTPESVQRRLPTWLIFS